MPSSHNYSLSRPLPVSVSSARALSILHEHSNIITLSPLVVDHHALPAIDNSAGSLSITYSITDRIDYLPLGLYSGNVTVMAEFTNQDDGVSTTRHAPLGFIIKERWIIREISENSAYKPATNEIVLDVELIAGPLVLPLFKSMMEKNHNGYIDGMIKVLGEDGKAGEP
jgi:hypothetical protein